MPILDYNLLQGTARRFEPTGDTLRDMDGISLAMEEAGLQERCHPLQRELAMLAAEAVQIQKPWVAEGLNHAKKVGIL